MSSTANRIRTWINVTTSSRWNRPAVGIVRVEQALALHLREQLGPDLCRLCVWEHGRFVQWVPAGETASSPDVEPAQPLPGDILVTVGLDWDHEYSRQFHVMAKLHRLRLVTCCYDMIPMLFPQYCVPEVGKKFADYFIEMTWAAEAVLCISEQTQRDYASVCADLCAPQRRTLLIRLGDSLPTAGSSIGPEVAAIVGTPFILFVSTIERRKNHEVLFRAYHVLARRGLAAELPQLVFVGMQGWGVDDLIRDIDLDPATAGKIVRLNHVNDGELELLYRNARFCLFPSLYEGWGLPVGEALAMGKAVIASREGAIESLGGDLVRYVPAWDTYAWADAIYEYATNPSLVADMEQRVRTTYVPRTWADTATPVATLLREMAANPPASGCALELLPGYDMNSACGLRCGAHVATSGQAGILLYGPHVPLRAGRYRLRIRGAVHHGHAGNFTIQGTSDSARVMHFSVPREGFLPGDADLLDCLFELPRAVDQFEVRCIVDSACSMQIDAVALQPADSLSDMEAGAAVLAGIAPGHDTPPVYADVPDDGHALTGGLTPTDANKETPAMNDRTDRSGSAPGNPQGEIAADLTALLQRHDRDFIRCAYLTLVKREPDDSGMAFYSRRLRSGVAKVQILAEMYASDEARGKGAHLPGLDRAMSRLRLARLPLIGRALAWLLDIDGDSVAQVRLRAIEQQLHALQYRLDTLGSVTVGAPQPASASSSRTSPAPEAHDPNTVLARSVVLAPTNPDAVIGSFRKALSGTTEAKTLGSKPS